MSYQSQYKAWAQSISEGDRDATPGLLLACIKDLAGNQNASRLPVYPSTGRKSYAGIGSRDTPEDVQELMTRMARCLEDMGYVLRSGGAVGADKAFQRGVSNPQNMEIWLPWSSFQGLRTGDPGVFDFQCAPGYEIAMAMVSKFAIPYMEPTKTATRTLAARNGMQILGGNMNHPSSFVYAWTPGGMGGGGTGQALRMARSLGIPVRDLGDPLVRQEVEQKLKEKDENR